MKAIVVEIRKKYAIALDRDGKFIKIKNTGNLNIGYEIDIPSKVLNFYFTKSKSAASVAAMLIVLFAFSIGLYCYFTPYSYVSIDINPSVEISLNIFDRVINVRSLNNDGKNILNSVVYKNKELKQVLQSVLYNALEEGYINNKTKNTVLIAISIKDIKETYKVNENIKELTQELFENNNIDTEIIVEKTSVKKRDEAIEKGMSQGKLLLIEKLEISCPDMVINDFKDRPVNEILNAINGSNKDINNLNKNTNNNDYLNANKTNDSKIKEDQLQVDFTKNDPENIHDQSNFVHESPNQNIDSNTNNTDTKYNIPYNTTRDNFHKRHHHPFTKENFGEENESNSNGEPLRYPERNEEDQRRFNYEVRQPGTHPDKNTEFNIPYNDYRHNFHKRNEPPLYKENFFEDNRLNNNTDIIKYPERIQEYPKFNSEEREPINEKQNNRDIQSPPKRTDYNPSFTKPFE